MKILKKHISLIILIIIIVLSCVLKQELIKTIPILANAGAVEDDELMIEHAKTILSGNWLGNYKYNTIYKNVFFSIFLALAKTVNISYINAVTLLYSIACVIFMIAISKLIKSKVSFVILFEFLLWNPVMYSQSVLQRVYRNSIIPALALIVVGSYIAMFLNRESKTRYIAIWSFIASIAFSSFYYTREDSMWLIPFIIFIISSTIIFYILKLINKKNIKEGLINIVVKVLFLLLPIIVTILLGNWIAVKNQQYYGEKIVNTQSNSKLSELTNLIYSIKPNIEIERVSNTREKINRMAEVSPSLAIIKPNLDKMMDIYAGGENEEVINGLFTWALITAVSNSGYDTLQKENELYTNIINELNMALDNKLLEKQNTMPFLGCEALKKEEYVQWFNTTIRAVKYISNYNNVNLINTKPSLYYPGLYEYMSYFKEITGNRVILEDNATDPDGNKMLELIGQEEYIKSVENKIKVFAIIRKIYIPLAQILELSGIISYIVLTITIIIEIFNKKYNSIPLWIIESAILGAILTLIIGVSYVEITQTNAIVTLYLSGAFPLFIAFSFISIYNIFIKFCRKTYFEK